MKIHVLKDRATLTSSRIASALDKVEIQREITRWYSNWQAVQNNLAKRNKLTEQTQAWSDEILKMPGLLDQ